MLSNRKKRIIIINIFCKSIVTSTCNLIVSLSDMIKNPNNGGLYKVRDKYYNIIVSDKLLRCIMPIYVHWMN